MYGGSKEAGQLVGRIQTQEVQVDVGEAADGTGCHESLRCQDGDGNELTLSAKLDPGSGELVWVMEADEAEVERRVLGTNQMTSMMHDTVRNDVYAKAIALNIAHFTKKMQRSPIVLDVGAGTGLLSMMAKKSGAEQVVGCEMFSTMASVAERVVEDNGMSESVQIIAAKSTDIDGFKADMLVSELLDSALLGESCAFSHSDAIERLLLEQDTNMMVPIEERVIPHSANIYGRLIECKELDRMHSVDGVRFAGSGTPWRNEEASQCSGGWPAIPVHWQRLQERSAAKLLSEEAPLLGFEFFRSGINDRDVVSASTDVTVSQTGMVSGLLLYWNLYLLSPEVDPERECLYTTRPGGGHWQDHWVQCVFPFRKPTALTAGQTVTVTGYHNHMNIWFEASFDQSQGETKKRTRPPEEGVALTQCSCGWHLLHPVDRLLMINDARRNQLFEAEVKKAIKLSLSLPTAADERAIVLDVGDASVLGLAAGRYLQRENAAAATGKQRQVLVVSKESKLLSRLFYDRLGGNNGLDDTLYCWDGEDFSEILSFFDEDEGAVSDMHGRQLRIAALISDTYHFQMSAKSTWQMLAFHYKRTAVAPLLLRGAPIVPSRARVMAVAFELTDLYVSHGVNGVVSGFDHSHLDERQGNWQQFWLPYKLADYQKKALCQPVELHVVDLSREMVDLPARKSHMPITASGRLDCLAVWVDYGGLGVNTDDTGGWLASFGPGNYPDQPDFVDFPPYMKVTLRFFPYAQQQFVAQEKGHTVAITSSFVVGASDFDIEFALKTQA